MLEKIINQKIDGVNSALLDIQKQEKSFNHKAEAKKYKDDRDDMR